MKPTRLLKPIGWIISVLVAGSIGYALITSDEAGPDARRQVKGASIKTAPGVGVDAGTKVDGKESRFPKSWPADAPTGGIELRDYVVKILRDDDPVERTFAYLSLLRCANKDNIGRLYDAWDLLRKEGVGRGEVEQPMNYRSGELDGAKAISRRTGSAYDLSIANYISVTLAGWNKVDPNAARAWVEALPDGTFREKMIETMVAGMAVSDPAGAQQLLAKLPTDIQANAARQMASQMRGKQGLGATLDWLEHVPGLNGEPPPAWVGSASASLINDGIRVKQMAGGVANAMEQRMANPAVTSENLIAIGKSYALASPEQALPWAVRIEAQGNEKAPAGQILGALIESSYSDKLPFVEKWLMDHPEVPGRDQAIVKLCKRLSTTAPDSVAQWVQQIKNPALRAATVSP